MDTLGIVLVLAAIAAAVAAWRREEPVYLVGASIFAVAALIGHV